MQMIIAPAKKMQVDLDSFEIQGLPAFLPETRQLLSWLRQHSYEELKQLWRCNDKLAQLNYDRVQTMDLTHKLTPALMAFVGLQYTAMSPDVFTENALRRVQKQLYIVSGFYGLLRPFDGVTPYRLEMQARAQVAGSKNLYDFWGDKLYCRLFSYHEPVINLASQEYSKAIAKYLQPQDTFLTCKFGEINAQGRLIQKGTYAKQARGDMVRFICENSLTQPEELMDFQVAGYQFAPEFSTGDCYAFIR